MRNLFVLAALGATALVACSPPPTQEAPPPPPAPRILDFRASSATVPAGAKVTLTWETKDATQVELIDSVRGKVSDPEMLSGSVELVPVEDSLFVLTASNARGAQVSSAISVRIDEGAGDIIFFASPSRVDAGGPTKLAWSALGAKEVSLKAQGGADIDLAGQLAEGSVTVRPEADTTYELSVDGKVETTTVQVRPVILSVGATPEAAVAGLPVTLNWQTLGAVRVTVQALHTGETITESDPAKVKAGSHSETIPTEPDRGAVFTWRLTAFGTAPESVTTSDVQVFLSGTPRITSFVAPEYAREGGTFQVSWATAETDQVVVEVDGVPLYVTPSKADAISHTLALDSPTHPVTLRLRAINFRGGEVEATAQITPVGIPSNMGFTVSPQPQIAQGGDPVTLTWNVPNARRLKITANGKYTVISRSGPGAETGTATVYPNEDTTYTLVAHNTVGDQVTDSQAVAVPVKAQVVASPGSPVGPRFPVDVAWNVPGAMEISGLPHSQIDTRMGNAGFIDIRPTGTRVPFQNPNFQYYPVDPDFETWIYGQRAPDQVLITPDGFLCFGGSTGSSAPTPLDLPSSAVRKFTVAPFWADLEVLPDSGVYWQVLGDAPERVLFVQWDNVHLAGQPNTSLTFQAQIHQTGVIKFEYRTLNAGVVVPKVGIQGDTNAHGIQYMLGAVSDSGLTFFGPVAPPVQVAFDTPEPVGGWVKKGDAYLKMPFTPSIILPGQVRVSEAMFNPAAAVSTTGEWIEVYNDTAVPMDAHGWTLDFGGGTTHLIDRARGQTLIPAKGTLVLGQSATAAQNDGAAVQYAYGTTFSMGDTSGLVQFVSGTPIATFAWTASMGGPGRSVVVDVSRALYVAAPKTCSTAQTYGAQSPLQTGTPGVAGSCFPYALSSIPANWEDVSGTGTAALVSADSTFGFGQVALPAPFTYFGTTYTQIGLTMGGLSSFGVPLPNTYVNSDVTPSSNAPNGVVAPFWNRLSRNAGTGSLVVQRRSNYTIISWHDFGFPGFGTPSHLFFQEKLFDSGVIEFHYGAMTPGTISGDAQKAAGSLAAVWIEPPDGLSALPVSVRAQNVIQPNTAWRFTPVTP